MKKSFKIILFILLNVCFILNLNAFAKDDDTILKSITLSNYDIIEGNDAKIYIQLKNTYKSKLKINNIDLYNDNIMVTKYDKNEIIDPSQEKIIVINIKAVKISTSYVKISINYEVNGNGYSICNDSSSFKIINDKNNLEIFFNDYIKDILLPLLIAMLSPIIVNYVIWLKEKKGKNEVNCKIIKSRLIYELKLHIKELQTNQNISIDKWDDIHLSELYSFLLAYYPEQLKVIEYYYSQIIDYNETKGSTERYKRVGTIESLNADVKEIIIGLFSEKAISNKKKITKFSTSEIYRKSIGL